MLLWLGTAKVRVVTIDDQPWFVAADVCEALVFSKHPTNRTYAHHLTGSRLLPLERRRYSVPTTVDGSKQNRSSLTISESGL